MPVIGNQGYPSHHESHLALKDGREVLLRPILTTDRDLIIDLFNRITPRSLYQRFLRNLDALPEDMLHHFTNINYETDFALVAVIQEDCRNAIVAVGRYAYDPHEDSTDLALAIRDDWQSLGLGKSLLTRIIAIAKEHGISHFGSMMDTKNTNMEKILRDLGYEVRYFLRNGFYQVEILV
jgi:GNAT superfamily N-acetyltransferase